jgi:hypothetical protein
LLTNSSQSVHPVVTQLNYCMHRIELIHIARDKLSLAGTSPSQLEPNAAAVTSIWCLR